MQQKCLRSFIIYKTVNINFLQKKSILKWMFFFYVFAIIWYNCNMEFSENINREVLKKDLLVAVLMNKR